MKPWVIRKPLATEERASNAPLVTNGRASNPIRNVNNNFAINMVSNTLAPARVTPVVPAPPAAENTPLAPAPPAMNGKMVVANNKPLMALKATCSIAMELSSELKIVL